MSIEAFLSDFHFVGDQHGGSPLDQDKCGDAWRWGNIQDQVPIGPKLIGESWYFLKSKQLWEHSLNWRKQPLCSMLSYHLATEVVDKQPYLPEVASMAWQAFFFISVLGQGSESYPLLASFTEVQALVSDSPESESRPDCFEFYFFICKMRIIIPIKDSMMWPC